MGQEQSIKFCGHQISAEDLALIQELAVDFWGIPRSELAATVCELLCWERPNGQLKTRECIFFLEDLGARGWLKLPRKRNTVRGKARPIARTHGRRAGTGSHSRDFVSTGRCLTGAGCKQGARQTIQGTGGSLSLLGVQESIRGTSPLPDKVRGGAAIGLPTVHEPGMEGPSPRSLDRLDGPGA